MNFILLNLIMAVFFFYYSNFYVKNVRLLTQKPRLFKKLIEERKKRPDEIIPDDLLQKYVTAYCENPYTNFHNIEDEEDEVDQKLKEIKKKSQVENL